jgi:biopolymer transport protein ExbD
LIHAGDPVLASWDVFHSDRLEVERGLSTAEVRAALGRGELHDDDLARPAGTSVPWTRIVDLPALFEAEAEPAPAPTAAAPPRTPVDDAVPLDAVLADEDEDEDRDDGSGGEEPVPLFATPMADLDDDEDEDAGIEPPTMSALIDDDEDEDEGVDPGGDFGPILGDIENFSEMPSMVAVPLDEDELARLELGQSEEEYDPQEEDEAAAEFTLSRGAAEKVEELDLAAMVDVAFQLVLFFLVTATTVLYKTLEVPKPNPDSPPGAVAQGQGRTLDQLKEDYILVEVDPAGAIKVDHEPAPPQMQALAERLRAARQSTGRTSMLLSADFATPHRNAVLAYDAANEIGLQIAIAKPAPPSGPGAR